MTPISKDEKTKNVFSFLNILKEHKKKIIIILLLVLAFFLFFILPKFTKKQETAPTNTTAVVDKGDITQVIEGNGTIEAIDQYEIKALVSGDITADYFEEGDLLQKGDIMYSLDSSDMDNTIARAEVAVEKAEVAYENALKAVNDLTVLSTASGTITNVYIKKGDQIAVGSRIVDVVDNHKMKLSIDFLSDYARNIYIGQSAQVELIGTFSTLTGTVSDIASGSMPNSYGVPVTTIEIDVINPGGILKGDSATAIIGDYACSAPGKFDYSNEITILSKSTGTVQNVNVTTNDTVANGTILTTLDNSSAHDALRQNELSLKEARLALENHRNNIDNYSITAPISGKVVQKNIKAGEKLDNTNFATPMAIISDLSCLVFTISVDELDFSDIRLGQKVLITADAFEGQEFTGVVDNISINSTSQNGVTSYPVRILVDDIENCPLIPGMNVNATIITETKTNVLRIPTAAVSRGNKVTLIDGTEVDVEIGLSDSSYIEIISGLKEGDQVIVPVINTASNPMMGMMGMAGSMGGGMSGGMPPANVNGGGSRP